MTIPMWDKHRFNFFNDFMRRRARVGVFVVNHAHWNIKCNRISPMFHPSHRARRVIK
jgi:hypothetical protein